jgi:hypothetical protein
MTSRRQKRRCKMGQSTYAYPYPLFYSWISVGYTGRLRVVELGQRLYLD